MRALKIGLPVLALGAILGTGSCKHDIPTAPPTLVTDTVCDPATVYFVNDILPIFNSSCAMSGCHDASSNQDGYTLNSYQGIMEGIKAGNPGDSEIFEKITDNDPDDKMPPPSSGISLTQAQIDLIYNWIAQGAPYNECTQTSNCDTANVTYSGTIAPILQANCVGCHSAGSVLLNSHAGVATVALNGRLMGALNHANGYLAMPSGQPQLDACTLQSFQAWVNAGAPNN